MIQTIFPGSKNRGSGKPGEADHSLPIDRMRNTIHLITIKTDARHKWHGMPWVQYGVSAGHSYLVNHFSDNIEWLNTHCKGEWSIICHVHMGKLPSAGEMHAGKLQEVTLGVELQFARPGYAVLYKLTWGNHE